MKLTAMQRKALEAMENTSVGRNFMPATVTLLVAKGLAKRDFGVVNFRPRYRITEAGRAALAKERG